MVVALVAGALLTVPATPALAANPDVQITDLPSGTLTSGEQTTMTFSVKNNNDAPTPFAITVSTFNGLSCRGGCDSTRLVPPGSSVDFTVTLVAGDLQNGQTRSGQVTVSAKAQGDQGSDSRAMTVRGPDAPPPPSPTPEEVKTVNTISGKVIVTANRDAVPNATVMLLDSGGHRYQTTSDGNGNFRFTGSKSAPITPGQIQLGASKDNIVNTKSISANAGQSLTGQRISLAIPVEVKPSATPSATAEPVPTEEPTEEPATEDEATEAPPAQAENAASEAPDSGPSWLLILLGGLFVAVGVGTIVLLLMKRKENADDDGPAAAPAGAVPAARGGYGGTDDQTRVVNRVGAGPDPTMVGGTAINDAPTMLQRPVVDDVPPDPYGAPPPPAFGGGGGQPGWAGSGGYGEDAHGQGGYGGYGNAPSSGGGYGNAPSSGGGYGNAPSSGAGRGGPDYGAPAGGYGGGQGGGGYGERYDEPTGRYGGEGTQSYAPPADPYPTSTYQPTGEPGHGYGQEPSYGGGHAAADPGGGYGGQGGYGGGQGGGYGGGQQGYDGYDQRGGGYAPEQQRGGYDQGGYGDQAGYGGQGGGYGQDGYPPEQRGGGYDKHSYDQQGGYYNEQGQQPGRGRGDGPQQDRGGRRLDWLDD
ncbi:carboxypeptidase-like regulatory domain-containing protein [Micromonospora sp. PLK6-60]|uniref:carboxypeptidase-like regulatory domain-containing protein n=1 Tax=Micromonospora sp. PLK6-60 TaxID=2873383 RepID=UPI0027DF97D3|nr:carboxypeptidase-like regulatory domain-containing protein [Micromonospora sp. PLK6-60]